MLVRTTPSLAVLVGVLALPAPAPAQVEFNVRDVASPGGIVAGNQFGTSLIAADMDGDGFDDLVAMEPGATSGGFLRAGRGWVLRGPDFEQASKLEPDSAAEGEEMGVLRGAVADVDGDGRLDVIATSPLYSSHAHESEGRVRVFFGPDYRRQEVISHPAPVDGAMFGGSVCATDLTGDGRDDIIVGAPGMGVTDDEDVFIRVGCVYVYDANRLDAPWLVVLSPVIADNTEFGSALRVDDLDRDEPADVLIGAQGRLYCCPVSQGSVYRFDAERLELTDEIGPPLAISARGFDEIAYRGDIDGDGIDDLIAAAPFNTVLAGQPVGGLAFIARGPRFDDVLTTFTSPTDVGAGSFAMAFVVADVDRDGLPDLIAGDAGQPADDDRVWLYYGSSYAEPQELSGFITPATGFGRSIATGDFDNDGWLELAVQAFQENQAGNLYIFDPRTLTAEPEVVAMADGGEVEFLVDVGSGQPFSYYLMLAALGAQDGGFVIAPATYMPLTPDATTFEVLGITLAGALPGMAGQLTSTGKAAFTLALPANFDPSLIGTTWTFAAVTLLADGRTPGIGTSTVEIRFER